MKKNIYWIISGFLMLLTAFVHTFAGQIDLVKPLLESNLKIQAKSEWMGAWHTITILIYGTSFYLLKNGFAKSKTDDRVLIYSIGILYCLISIPFLVSSFYFKVLAPQWIILLPIGILAIIGVRKVSYHNIKIDKKELPDSSVTIA